MTKQERYDLTIALLNTITERIFDEDFDGDIEESIVPKVKDISHNIFCDRAKTWTFYVDKKTTIVLEERLDAHGEFNGDYLMFLMNGNKVVKRIF